MVPVPEPFEYTHRGCDLVYGRGCIDRLAGYLAGKDLERAMVVCGSNVGSNDELMGMIEEALAGKLARVFDETTPEKRIQTVFAGIEAADEATVDVVVGLGGGSSLDVARQISVFANDDRSLADVREEASEGEVEPPTADAANERLPVVVVPTTLAGADLSGGGSVEVLAADEAPTAYPVRAGGSVTPVADFVDPVLFETTPVTVLEGSAMNGFNKGLETVYARDAHLVSDATAIHSLRLLAGALPAIRSFDTDVVDRAVAGTLLGQLNRKVSVIHAFGHGFSRLYDVQQGVVHAVVTPDILDYIFETVDANRRVLAESFGTDTAGKSDGWVADAVVGEITAMLDQFDLPTRLRDVPETREEDLPEIAEFIHDDSPMSRTPAGLDPDPGEIEAVLREAW